MIRVNLRKRYFTFSMSRFSIVKILEDRIVGIQIRYLKGGVDGGGEFAT